MPVTADFVVDFAVLDDVSPYTDADLLQVGSGTVKVETGALKPVAAGAARRLMYSGAASSRVKSFVQTITKADFDYIVPGVFNDAGAGFVLVPVSGKLYIKKIDTGTTVSHLTNGDFAGFDYVAGDTVALDYDDATDTIRVYNNDVWQMARTSDTYTGPLRPGVYVRAGSTGTISAASIGFNGVTVAAPASITAVNAGAAVTQYQQGVAVTYENLDPTTITAMTLNGVACTYDAAGAFNAPGSLASGTYTLEVVAPTGTVTAQVPYTRTHPIQVPAAGTTVHINSVFAQMGNPGGRYISLTKPELLAWKSPHNSFTAANCALDIAGVLSAPSGAVDGAEYDITGSLIDSDGVIAPFTFAAAIDDEVVDPPPPIDPGDWPFGLNLSWLAPGNWLWGRRHPKTNQRVRKWMGQ